MVAEFHERATQLPGRALAWPHCALSQAAVASPGGEPLVQRDRARLVTRDQTDRTSAFTMLLTAGACFGGF